MKSFVHKYYHASSWGCEIYCFKKNLKAMVHCEAFNEIQFQEHFMKHEMLSWNTFTLVFKLHCIIFSSIKKCVCREKIPCKI